MITTTLAFLWKFFAVFLIVVAVIDLLTMSQSRKVSLYRARGYSQKAIAERLGISTYKVRKLITNTAA